MDANSKDPSPQSSVARCPHMARLTPFFRSQPGEPECAFLGRPQTDAQRSPVSNVGKPPRGCLFVWRGSRLSTVLLLPLLLVANLSFSAVCCIDLQDFHEQG